MPDVERNVLYTHFDYDINPDLTFSTDFSWGKVDTADLQRTPSNTLLCIRPDNAYLGTLDANSRALLSGAVGQQVTGGASGIRGSSAANACPTSAQALVNPLPSLPWLPAAVLTKDFGPQQTQGIDTVAEVYRAVFDISGRIGSTETWSWDAYYETGHATRDQVGDDYRTQYRFLMAMDSVINPATGQPDCRVNVVTDPASVYPIPSMDPFLVGGCAPINPFGLTMSDAAHDYAFDPLEEYNTIDQDVLAGSVSGDLWKGWGAGACSARSASSIAKRRWTT